MAHRRDTTRQRNARGRSVHFCGRR